MELPSTWPREAHRLRLALLTNAIPPYRVDTFIELARHVERFSVLVSSPRIAAGLEGSPVRIETVAGVRIPVWRRHPNGYRERGDLHLPVGIGRRLRRLEPHVVIAVELGIRTVQAIRYRLRNRDARLLIHADVSEDTERGDGALRRRFRTLALRFADRVLVNGRSGLRYVAALGYPAERIVLLPYATDVKRFCGERTARDATAEIRLLYVGQLIERKGVEPFLRLLADHLSRHPECKVRLTLAGAGDRAAAIRRIGLPANLRLDARGPIRHDDLPGVYAGADVFVLPTLADTWAVVVNEAMAGSLPVLGSVRSQAVDEMVIEGESGWRFDALAPDSVRDALDRMLRTPAERRREMGERARAAARLLSPDAVARRLAVACADAR